MRACARGSRLVFLDLTMETSQEVRSMSLTHPRATPTRQLCDNDELSMVRGWVDTGAMCGSAQQWFNAVLTRGANH